MPYSLTDMTLYFFIYSFCGWLMETVLCSVQERRFVNRGFLNGPLCPIYGCGVALMLIFLIPVRDGVDRLWIALPVVFLAGAVLASVVEYVTSWAMEKLFHARWWDYSHYRFHLNGRICLPISLAWGVLATGFIYWVQPLFERLVASLYATASWLPGVVASVLFLLFLVDAAVSFRVARAIGNKLEQLDKWSELIREHLESIELPGKDAVVGRLEAAYAKYALHSDRRAAERQEKMAEWRALPEADLRRRLADAADELKARKEEAIAGTRALQRRMLRAFPHLRGRGRTTAARDLREYWKKQKEERRSKRAKKGKK